MSTIRANFITDSTGTTGPTFPKGYTEAVFEASGPFPTINASDGSIQTWSVIMNSGPSLVIGNGQSITLMVTSNGYMVSWPSVTWKTNSGAAPTLNMTGVTVIVLWKVGGVIYGARVGDN